MSLPAPAAFRLSPLATLICALLIPLAAGAQSAPAIQPVAAVADDDTTELAAVVVTGVLPSHAMTWETDPHLPRQPVPASDGADYLRTIPGFSTVRNGGTNGDPVLRGMFGSRLNLIAGDGATHGACPSRMDNAMSYVAPETYDRLVVIKGPQSVRWGAGASAGTVRFERERPRFEQPGVQGTASLLAGSHARHDQTLDATVGHRSAFARISANHSRADDYEDGGGRRVPSAWDKWNADASIGWTPDANTLLQATVGRGDGEARYAGRGMDGTRFDRDTASLRFVRDDLPGNFGELDVAVYRNRVDHVMDNYSLRDPNPQSAMPMPMASNVARDTRGARASVEYARGAFEWVVGFDVQDSRHRRRSAMGRGAYRSQPWLEDARMEQAGAFAEMTWRVAEDRRLLAGARIDRAQARDLRPTTGGVMPHPNPTFRRTREETLPAGFVRWERGTDTDALQWFAGVGHVQRMPDYWELFSPQLGPVGAPNAFAGVRPERTTQFDAGFQRAIGRGTVWMSAYAGHIDDFVLFDYGRGMMASTRARNVDARIGGLEAGAEYRPTRAWKLEGSLAYAWGRNLDDHRPLPQMPPLEARLGASWRRGSWSFGGLVRAAARQTRVAVGQGNVTGRDIGESPGFAVFSVNAAYRAATGVQFSAGIDNLFDRRYSEHLNLGGSADFGYPADPVRIDEPGRTLWLKLTYTR
jgi:iron complex outermembrane receptor protein